MRVYLFSVLSSALLFFSGCGSDDLPDYFLLDRLRVVAATTATSAAEFSPGDSVNLSFHLIDPLGRGRSLFYSMVRCVDPGVSLGAYPSCAGNPTVTAAVTGTFVPGSAATNHYGVLAAPAFTLPSAAVVYLDPRSGSSRSAVDQFNGVGYLVVLTLTASPTETLTTFKRVIVSSKPTKNNNPTFASPALLMNGADASSVSLTAAPVSLREQLSSGSTESYSVANADGSFSPATESLTVSWLVTSGEMRVSRTDPGTENKHTPANPLPAVTSYLLIARDDRGGSTVYSLQKP
ncbi:MAG: hypothetical protein H7301_05510 [Cryobacterium sp.]|nr:hypothetical protein [Oligoflexia bacterium]